MPNTREKLIKLIGASSCHGNGESLGSCPDRKYGMCGEMANLSYCVIQNLVNHLIANGVTVQEWIPVTERLPEKSGWYLAVRNRHAFCVSFSAEHKMFNCHDTFSSKKAVKYHLNCTHWMPLPEPPKEVE